MAQQQQQQPVHPLANPQWGLEIWKKTLFGNKDVPDYTFEERYVRGTPRPSYPERDELDRLSLLRVESLPIRVNWCISGAFLESVLSNPTKIAYIWCDENGNEVLRHSYKELYDKSRSIAAHLLNTYKFQKGNRVLLVYEPCVEFYQTFWACIFLGIIPVPVCPPDPFNLAGDHTDKLASIYIDSKPKAILTSSKYKDSIAAASLLYPDLYQLQSNAIMDSSQYLWIPTDSLPYIPDDEFEICLQPCEFSHLTPELRVKSGTEWYPMFNPQSQHLYKPKIYEEDIAFLQYTSGSTGLAKGVIVHHRMLGSNIFNCALLTQGLGSSYVYQWALGVSWLPSFHDMGLIGFHVTPMIVGGTMVYQSPIHFIQNPISWLQIISKLNHTFTGAPPFALDLLCKRTSNDELKQLNLHGLDALVLGAEPIRASYMESFATKFKSVGFNEKKYVTCFGMAENVLHVTGKWGVGYGVSKILVSSKSLRNNNIDVYQTGRVELQSDGTTFHTIDNKNTNTNKNIDPDDELQWLVSSGELIPFNSVQTLEREIDDSTKMDQRRPHFARREHGSHVIIVDPNTKIELPDGHIGEVWILSSSKTAGYWNRPELSQEQFHAQLHHATKQTTKDLIYWVENKLPRLHNGIDIKGNLDPTIQGRSLIETLADPSLQSTLLTNSLSTTTLHPTKHTLIFNHANTPLNDIKVEWLRTGDMAVIHNNEIYITGRIKDMIILRGQNFYADDIEHAISTDTNDLTQGNVTSTSSTTTVTTTSSSSSSSIDTGIKRSPALDFIRPGHAIAYSIELTPTKQSDPKNDPVVKANVEGEHLCLLVELTSDIVSSIITASSNNNNNNEIEIIGTTTRLTDSDDDNDNINDDELLVADTTQQRKNVSKHTSKATKTGNQAPYWQRVLNTYSKELIGGMSTLKKNDLDTQQQLLQQPQTCNERMALYARQFLFHTVRMGIATGNFMYSTIYPTKQVTTTTSTTSSSISSTTSSKDQKDIETISNIPQKQSFEIDGELIESNRYLPPDTETKRLQQLYPQSQLNTIASAIRRIISTKFMLVVDKIVFIAPRTIKKTSSGKKRRNDTVYAVEHHYYDHRVIGYSFSKQMQLYNDLITKNGLKGTVAITNQEKSKLSTNHQVAQPTTTSTASTTKSSSTTTTSSTNQQQHYAGTVGISLNGGLGSKYNTDIKPPTSLISKSTETMIQGGVDKESYLRSYHAINPKENDYQHVQFKPNVLLPNYKLYQEQFNKQDQIHANVKKIRQFAQTVTFDTIKPRVLQLICNEINALHKNDHNNNNDTNDESIAPIEQIRYGDGNTILTVSYLNEIATKDADEQAQLLDEFGLDSITGFKLSKAFADEFNLSQNTLGPHLFINDSTLDGVVRVIVNLIKSTALKLTQDYEKTYNTTFTDEFKPVTTSTSSSTTSSTTSSSTITTTPLIEPLSNDEKLFQKEMFHTQYDSHDKTAAYVFRGSTSNLRIPYILGIGTSTPHIGAPQEMVIEAMLQPMKMDEKSNERFRKIGQHSGIGTRYSVLDNLGQIFWGKEGVNQDNDEFIDIRQQVYKREAVKLSIQSAADAVQDWLGEKIYLNDDERDIQRKLKYDECERLHMQYTKSFDNHNDTITTHNNKGKNNNTKTNGKHSPSSLESSSTKPSPIEEEYKIKQQQLEKLKQVKSFAEGDSHLVETTSGNKEIDKQIASLGTKMIQQLDRTITHIVAITCTGIIVPGLEFHIMKALNLPNTTQRLPVTFAGCFGAVSGLRTASALANENPLHRVLVVCTELCTLHMQLSDKIDNLIGSALFADGSGSFIVGCAPTINETPIFSIDTLSSYVIPNTVQQMAWEATKSGQVIGLAKEIASEIFNVIGDVVDDMLRYTPDPIHPEHRIQANDCNLAIHPGGPLIINTIQGGFGLPPVDDSSLVPYTHPVAETWKILHEYGNMSSATLVYVLDRLRLQKDKNNKPTPTLAFGPGLSVECSLLHRLNSNPGDKNKINQQKKF